MTIHDEQITYLIQHIQKQEAQIAGLEAEIRLLDEELSDFEYQYDRIVKPISDQIEAVKGAIEKLEALHDQQLFNEDISIDDLLYGRKSTSHQANPPPPEDDDMLPSAEQPDHSDPDLKALYRQLARRYHPDFAEDEADRQHRTELMSLINKAYHADDIQALRDIQLKEGIHPEAEAPMSEPSIAPSADVSQLRRLQAHTYELQQKIDSLLIRKSELRYGTLMQLKLEASLARAKGDDVLQSIADELQKDYWELVKKLNKLRAQVR